ncbi:3-hydroxyisobutyrate dehydrogenase-like 2 [Homarus americanus]|uniref:3-hydroxyisobutyrate dehydrogenase-like 2 n=1 Tax=Homarus americanus TaxID=6706 RepID=A0A8J5K6L4_HOMAM|nr:3-hydroxyisobutyrate dehydrogenase-like 2 [Homarus americanus]
MFRCVRACVHLSRCTRVGRRGLHGASQATTVGVVGCGNVGAAVSHNLHRQGFRVVGAYDPDPARYADLPPGVTYGILAGLSKDKVWIDHSTTDSDQTMVYSEEAQKVGAYVLEAPITGGLASLKKGQMVVHLGGDKRVADAMTPLLNASYSKVFYVGEIGTAMMVKVISNMLACVHIIAMGEVLMLGKRAQLDLKTLWQAIRVSAGNSFVWETGAPLVFTGSYDPGFTMALQNKDLQLGYDMARKYESVHDRHPDGHELPPPPEGGGLRTPEEVLVLSPVGWHRDP